MLVIIVAAIMHTILCSHCTVPTLVNSWRWMLLYIPKYIGAICLNQDLNCGGIGGLDYHMHSSLLTNCCLSFLPEASFGLRVLSLPACVCVCLFVNHELVRAIIHQPFKPGSPNLDQRCKRPWLRSLLFCGVIDGDLQGQIGLESQNLPYFWLVSLSGR